MSSCGINPIYLVALRCVVFSKSKPRVYIRIYSLYVAPYVLFTDIGSNTRETFSVQHRIDGEDHTTHIILLLRPINI